jgi:predicted DNA-binding transcriptional regulator AlpA
LAEATGMSKQSVSNYYAGRKRGDNDFPLPLLVLKATPVWSRSEVLSWWANRGEDTK